MFVTGPAGVTIMFVVATMSMFVTTLSTMFVHLTSLN